jgi:hypothetical protein
MPGVEQQLDLSPLHTALAEGRAHRMWMLTTYQTMTNYQIPLGCIPFSAIVFDEIQALKNPGTLAAGAAKAMNGDFRIGLTGTPVENAVTDLWANPRPAVSRLPWDPEGFPGSVWANAARQFGAVRTSRPNIPATGLHTVDRPAPP